MPPDQRPDQGHGQRHGQRPDQRHHQGPGLVGDTASGTPRAPDRIGVVGGGIVGLAIAREVVRRRSGTQVIVWEKEDRVAAHQTGHNSGVVHAGIYYRPGTLKAELCTRGRHLLAEFCAEHGIGYEACGKVVVALDPEELPRLDALAKSATANGVPGLRRLGPDGIRAIEPHARGLAALHSPATAITDYVAVAEAMARELVAAGGEVRLNSEVAGIRRVGDRVRVDSRAPGGTPARKALRSQQSQEPPTMVDRLVVCAGLQSDRTAALVHGQRSPRIIPFRGEYLQVNAAKRDVVRGMVYPVPDPRYPFLGVHFTRRVNGDLEIGPNAILATAREGYRRRDLSWGDLADTLGWPGFWRLARQHWRTGIAEAHGSLSVGAYLERAQRYVPSVGLEDVSRGGAGVRAQAIDRDGSLLDDFRITQSDGITCIRNAPSPAATSSLAIAAYVVDRLD